MGRLLKTRGSEGAARLLVADCDGMIRDGSELRLTGGTRVLNDGDMILFRRGDDLSPGIKIDLDGEGLHSMISFTPSATLRIGLEALGEGVYAFRPAPHHMDMWPELRADGRGAKTR